MNAVHEGEQAVQHRAGEGGPGWGSPMFGPEIPPGFVPFLREQRLLILGAAGDDGAVWSSVVDGPPGFAAPVDDRTVVIHALPAPGDPLRDAFDTEREVGVLALHPQTRRRIRINGTARRTAGGLVVRTSQVLGNCPKYLQTRTINRTAATAPGPAATSDDLGADERRWISNADTFFIASHSPADGADASHRGGMPGFVTVVDSRRIAWPDYTGNQFYMTLGNLHLHPAAGLLFLDWGGGHTLQLTGRARIDWDPERARQYPGAQRVVEFDIAKVVRIEHASSLRWDFHAYSRVNPPVG